MASASPATIKPPGCPPQTSAGLWLYHASLHQRISFFFFSIITLILAPHPICLVACIPSPLTDWSIPRPPTLEISPPQAQCARDPYLLSSIASALHFKPNLPCLLAVCSADSASSISSFCCYCRLANLSSALATAPATPGPLQVAQFRDRLVGCGCGPFQFFFCCLLPTRLCFCAFMDAVLGVA